MNIEVTTDRVSLRVGNPDALPKVTVAIPTFNGAGKVEKALKSVLVQDYPNMEILVSDNASGDDTWTVCTRMMRNDTRVHCIRQETNIGMLANFDFLLGQATGRYFMWLSDDDALAPGAITRYVHFLENNADYAIVSGIIEYREGKSAKAFETNFSIEYAKPTLRLVTFYGRVVFGGLFHGLMRTEIARRVQFKYLLGSDWHFVAGLAYLGKIKMMDFVGYHKRLGGASRDFENYVAAVKESNFARRFPHLKIAADAYRDIAQTSPLFDRKSASYRYGLAFCAALAVLVRYYVFIWPLIVGGKLKSGLSSVRKLLYSGIFTLGSTDV